MFILIVIMLRLVDYHDNFVLWNYVLILVINSYFLNIGVAEIPSIRFWGGRR